MLAAPMAARRGYPKTTGILENTAKRRTSTGFAYGPSAFASRCPSAANPRASFSLRINCPVEVPGSGRRRHPVYGTDGGISVAAELLLTSKRYSSGYGNRQPQLQGDGKSNRIFCEYAGSADSSRCHADFQGTLGPGAESYLGSLCPPGRSV